MMTHEFPYRTSFWCEQEPPRRLLLWMSLGIILWSAAFTLAGALGLAGIQSLSH